MIQVVVSILFCGVCVSVIIALLGIAWYFVFGNKDVRHLKTQIVDLQEQASTLKASLEFLRSKNKPQRYRFWVTPITDVQAHIRDETRQLLNIITASTSDDWEPDGAYAIKTTKNGVTIRCEKLTVRSSRYGDIAEHLRFEYTVNGVTSSIRVWPDECEIVVRAIMPIYRAVHFRDNNYNPFLQQYATGTMAKPPEKEKPVQGWDGPITSWDEVAAAIHRELEEELDPSIKMARDMDEEVLKELKILSL